MIRCLFIAVLFSACTVAAAPKKVILIAGPITGHPSDTHEYEKNVTLLKHLLDQQSDKFVTEAHYRGWPTNADTLNTADTIFFTSDGTDHSETNHPLYVGDHFKVIERQMNRGCGIIFFHWSTFHPSRLHDQITDWVGGYFDYESGPPPRNWYSAIQTWNADAMPRNHPITTGVKPFRVEEEFYYAIRFRQNDARIRPVLTTRPPNEKQTHQVGWAVERQDGGRGFGFTGGHFYKNWWSPDFRKLVLNAIAWTAKAEVPAKGIDSKLEERTKVLIVGNTNSGRLAFALEQDPRLIVHVAADDVKTTNNYQLIVLTGPAEVQPQGKAIHMQPGESPAAVRRRCVAALGLSPLSFEPPAELVQFAIPRQGSQWAPR